MAEIKENIQRKRKVLKAYGRLRVGPGEISVLLRVAPNPNGNRLLCYSFKHIGTEYYTRKPIGLYLGFPGRKRKHTMPKALVYKK